MARSQGKYMNLCENNNKVQLAQSSKQNENMIINNVDQVYGFKQGHFGSIKKRGMDN